MISELEKAIGHLSLLHTHDALCLRRNAMAMPKLLYILRTSSCSGNNLLKVFDETLHKGLSSILNVDLSDDQWTQVSLPVHMGGLGVRSAELLTPSAFLPSAASNFSLQNDIFAGSIQSFIGAYTSDTIVSWKSLSNADFPLELANRYHKLWDTAVAMSVYDDILSRCSGAPE